MLAALLLLAIADTPRVDREELKKLQGKWIVTESEHGGKKTPVKELMNLSLEVQGTKMITYEAGELKEGTTIIGLDPKAKPATLDLKVEKTADHKMVIRVSTSPDKQEKLIGVLLGIPDIAANNVKLEVNVVR